jgi:hypothetical protein
VKTVHEFFTNKRMAGGIFVHSWFYSWMVSFARVESLPVPILWGRGRMSEAGRQVDGLFESLLAQSFDGGR